MTERIHPSLFVCSLPHKRDECEWALASSNHSRLVGSVEPLFVSRESNAVNYKAMRERMKYQTQIHRCSICDAVSIAEIVFRSVKHSHDLPEASVSSIRVYHHRY